MSKDKKLTLDQQRQKDLDKAMRAGDQKEIKRLRSIIKSVQQNKAKQLPNPRNYTPSIREYKAYLRGDKDAAGTYGKLKATGKVPKTKVPRVVSKAEKAYIENLKKTGQEVPKKLIGRAGTSPTAGRDIRSKQFIGKKMNMGGVMKNRGGTFKGVF